MTTNTLRSLFRLPLRKTFSTSVAPQQGFTIGRSYDGVNQLEQRSRVTSQSPRFESAPPADALPANEQNNEFTPQEMLSNANRFRQGEIYSPHDLTIEEMKKKRVERRRKFRDVFDVLGLNPIDEYKNFNLLGDYVSSMGRILHSSETGLRPVNQRRIAKAIRRAVGIGLLPSVHKHPELLVAQEQGRQANTTRARKQTWRAGRG